MKRILLVFIGFFLALLLLFVQPGCDPSDPLDNLYGMWNWVQSSGGIAGVVLTPASEGYTQGLKLEKSNFYTRYKDNVVTQSGTFQIVKETSILNGKEYDFITFSGESMRIAITRLDQSHLGLMEDVFDGFSHSYEK